jgi:hypothetical protein
MKTLIAASVTALAIAAPAASAQGLPDARTHADPATELTAAQAGGQLNPKLTKLSKAETARSARKGFLPLLARCDIACRLDVVAEGRFNGRWRFISATSVRLPAKRLVKIRLKIHSDVRRVASGMGFAVRYHSHAYSVG